MDESGRPRHLPALDGLRGAAVAGVVAFHLGYLDGGYLGVDLFFTLSGFLITRLLIAEHRTHGRISVGSFLSRRARRLLPALLAVLAAVAVANRRWGSPTDYARVRGDSLATLGYVANWRAVLADTDYWAMFARPSPLQHTWSLAIEEQFYLVWPLLVIGAFALSARFASARRSEAGDRPGDGGDGDDRARERAVVLLLVGTLVAAATSITLAIVLPEDAHGVNRIYFGTDTRVAAILLGAALALATSRFGVVRGRRARIGLEVAALVAVGGLALAWMRLSGNQGFFFDGGLALCGIAAAVIIAAISHPTPGPLTRAFSWRPLAALGLISYGLYLWHWPVITFLTVGRVGWSGGRLTLLRIAVSLGLALVSYHLIERPVRLGALSGWAGRLAAPAAFAAVLGIVLLATSGGVTPISEQPTGREALRVADDPVPAIKRARTRMLVVGDSGAYEIGPALGEVGRSADVEVVGRGTPACGVARGDGLGRWPEGRVVADPPGCGDWPTRWSDHLRDVEPDVVLLFAVAPGGVARHVGGRWRTDCDPVFDRWYQGELEDAMDLLDDRGARVAATTIAYFDASIDTGDSHRHTDCRNRTIRRAAAATGTRVVDLFGWVCPGGRCRTRVETPEGASVELRPDGMHYSGDGAVVASRWILDQLDRD